jgi:hypothetical protein
MESAINQGGKNLYTPVWLPVSDLPNTRLLPLELREVVIDGLANGFPNDPIRLTVRS